MLQRLLPLNGRENGLMRLDMDENSQPVPLCKTGDEPISMLPGAGDDVGRHADIKRPVAPTAHDVDPNTMQYRIVLRYLV
jgi:hypothetical protein